MILEEKTLQIKKEVNESAKDLYLSLLGEGKSVYLNAWGMSMYPFIKNADRIKVEPINGKEIKIGDIVAVDMKNKKGPWFFVHRVVKIIRYERKRIYFTKGDAHKKGLDYPVTIELIEGKITQIQRRNLKINLELPIWRYLNNIIAKLSFSYPEILHFSSRYISLIVEWRSFLFKLKNRLKKENPVLYNTEELLLICARKDLNEKLKKKATDLIKEGIQWEGFSESAMRSGVAFFTYNALKGIAPYTHIPQFVFDRLKFGYSFIVSKSTCQHKELMELLKLFAQKDISLLPLKGTVLSKRLYGDIAARSLGVDIDLLIKEKDKERATALLEDIGYSFNPDNEVKSKQWQYLFSKPKAVMIDLHWDITPAYQVAPRINGLWQGTRYKEGAGIGYYEFQEEELLLYLSAHLVSSDCFSNLKYVCDINELLHKYKDILDWDSIIKKAKSWRLSNSLYLALMVSKALLDSDLPLEVLSRLKPFFLKLIWIKIFVNKKVILRNGIRRRFINGFLCYIFFELIEAQSPKEYLSIFKKVFFPSKEVMGKRNYIVRILKKAAGLLKTMKTK
ncbi:MAG: hypothetical protein A2166_03145 [Omnitrophica WOR_2 bacterium RBG_13_41_10]|nr:MAG: hypothetical protein A2166_03145 [Omnitrophica WOR_2 bacterium RBG_13_41_10]